MATQEQIDALVLQIKGKLINKGFKFGQFTPDFQELFTQAYAEVILDNGGGASAAIDWNLVDVESMIAVLSGQITSTELHSDLLTPIESLPTIAELQEKILNNISAIWDTDSIYRVGEIISYGTLLYECTNAILTTPNVSPDFEPENWKIVGNYSDIYNEADNLSTRIFNSQSTADGALTDISALSSVILGDNGLANAEGLIFDQEYIRTEHEKVIVEALYALSGEIFGEDGAAIVAGYINTESGIVITPETINVDLSETISGRLGDSELAISEEKTLRGVALGADFDTGTAYENLATVVIGGTFMQNQSGSTIPPGPYNVADGWVAIENSLYAQYTVKVDVDGNVAGFGLSNDGSTSNFIINANNFAISSTNSTQESQDNPTIPFMVLDGVTYIKTAYIRDLSAENFVANTIVANSVVVGGLGWNEILDTPIELQDGSFAQIAEDTLTLAVNSGEIVNELPGINDGIDNFNTRNDRIAVTPDTPTILGDGSAITFTFNSDGSANIDFAWEYGTGTDETNIDGFLIYARANNVDTIHDLQADLTETNFFQVQADVRLLRMSGLIIDKYYTVGIEAFRVVDQDVDATGIKRSVIIQPSLTAENPIFLDLTVPAPTAITITEL
jgi:hypothetical protein